MTETRRDLLFLCLANSARSQMAEGWARQLAPPDVGVHSAGSESSRLHPFVVRAMAEVGIDNAAHRAKPSSAVPAERIARVVTLCAAEICPAFPGEVERLHWPLPDPAAAGGSDVPGNRIALCAFHHQRCLHVGFMRILGRVPDGLVFELGLRRGTPPLVSYRSGDIEVPRTEASSLARPRRAA